MSKRIAKIQRDTKETQIFCEVNIDGIGKSDVETCLLYTSDAADE